MSDARPLDTYYLHASGLANNDCCFIGQRFDQAWGYRPRESESWLMRDVPFGDGGEGVRTSAHMPSDTRYAGLWMSRAGKVYVADATRCAVYHCPEVVPDQPVAWTASQLPAAIQGVWGLSDESVYAWGGAGERYPMFRWDGARWHDMVSPGFQVYAVHGLAPDVLWAVGERGQVASFDGGAWRTWPTPTAELLLSVFAVSRDEVYACGNEGTLLEGGPGGWGRIAEGPVPGLPLHGVAWWNDALWVGARQFGLLRRVERTHVLEVVKPNIWAMSFDARASLVITTPTLIAGTADGKVFRAAAKDALATQLADVPLLDPVRRR